MLRLCKDEDEKVRMVDDSTIVTKSEKGGSKNN